jgi:hypothetical protein
MEVEEAKSLLFKPNAGPTKYEKELSHKAKMLERREDHEDLSLAYQYESDRVKMSNT